MTVFVALEALDLGLVKLCAFTEVGASDFGLVSHSVILRTFIGAQLFLQVDYVRLHLRELGCEVIHIGILRLSLLCLGLEPRLHTGLGLLLLTEVGPLLIAVRGTASGFFPSHGLPVVKGWFAVVH